jgi:hypothetical protein
MNHIINNMNKLSIQCKYKIDISNFNNIKFILNNNHKSTSIILTRLLYLKDEVEYMILLSLLKNDLYQTIFWVHELYYSGFEYDTFKLLHYIYLLFYAELNPKFHHYIIKRYHIFYDENESNYKNFDLIINIIINIIRFNYTFNVFIVYNILCCDYINYNPTPYKGRKPKFLENYESKFHTLLLAINKKDYFNMALCLKHLPIDSILYNVLIHYFINVENVNLYQDKLNELYNDYINNELNNCIITYIIYIIFICHVDQKDVNLKKIYHTINDDIKNYYISLSNYQDIKTYNILSQKRLYGVNDLLSIFHLSRDNLDKQLSLSKLITFHGYYFSSYSPLWNKILYDIDENWSYDHNNYQIIFTSEDIKEIFENGFNLEHDEQPLDIQNYAIKQFNQCTFHDLINCLSI